MLTTTVSVVMAGTIIGFANLQTASAVTLGLSFQNTTCKLTVFNSEIDCSSAPPLVFNGTIDINDSPSPDFSDLITDFNLNVLAPALSSQTYNLSKSALDNLFTSGVSADTITILGNIVPADGDIGSIGVDSSGLFFEINAFANSIDTIRIYGNALLPQVLPPELLTLVPSDANPSDVEQFIGLLPKTPESLPFSLLLSGDLEISPINQTAVPERVPESSTILGTALLGVGGLLIKRGKGKKLAGVQAS
ncbi:PEP-CTERM sorting domain-containing protein [Anabaena sp. UHCC 0204]|uniref:PEP-CTERM sorting domain-containing protein n=1 Tax=Anabaena sp. UHCC 0204 TaxID=2590009 RepID=UPI0014455A6D|nr:PEP-CTERM sorting domain-containing protein [Anabaena sp. UHCC 0204]